jgi:hypothetical protein
MSVSVSTIYSGDRLLGMSSQRQLCRLSGGRVVCNHKTWYAHMFRTAGGDFGFPYPQKESKVQEAKAYAKDIFFNNKWDKAIHHLSWLIDRFKPIPGWTDEDIQKLKDGEHR